MFNLLLRLLTKKVLLSILSVFLLFIYVHYAFVGMNKVNIKAQSIDQTSYIMTAHYMKASNYQNLGNRNQSPLYPCILSFFFEDVSILEIVFTELGFDSDLANVSYFEKNPHSIPNEIKQNAMEFLNVLLEKDFVLAKKISILLSIFSLMLIGYFIRSELNCFYRFLFLIIITFSLYLYLSFYVKSEIMYYTLSFWCFILSIHFLQKQSIKLQSLFAFGLLFGITYLTKASILVMMLIFIFFLVLRSVKKYLKETFSMIIRKTVLSVASILSGFLLITSVYGMQNYQQYGSYLFNVNSQYYMWYESWTEVEKSEYYNKYTYEYADHHPTMRSYLRTHTVKDITMRVVNGCQSVATEIHNRYFTFVYLFFGILAGVLLFLLNKKEVLCMIRDNIFLALFIFSFFLSYFLLYSFYAPISNGTRFLFALYVPFLFVCFKLFEKLYQKSKINKTIIKFTCLYLSLTLIYELYNIICLQGLFVADGF